MTAAARVAAVSAAAARVAGARVVVVTGAAAREEVRVVEVTEEAAKEAVARAVAEAMGAAATVGGLAWRRLVASSFQSLRWRVVPAGQEARAE